MPTGEDGSPLFTGLQKHVGVGFQEFGGHVDDSGLWGRESQVTQERRGDPFVGKDSPVLGVVEELDHIGVAVGAFQQVCLRASAHFANEANGVHWHERLAGLAFYRANRVP